MGGRSSEAIQKLSPENFTNLLNFEQTMVGCKSLNDHYPATVEEAVSAMRFNMASAYCYQGDYDKCKQTLRQLVSAGVPRKFQTQSVLLSAYVELKNGNTETALKILKSNSVFPVPSLSDRLFGKGLSPNGSPPGAFNASSINPTGSTNPPPPNESMFQPVGGGLSFGSQSSAF